MIVDELQVIAHEPDQEMAIGQLLLELKVQVNGRWRPLLRQLRPDLGRPEVWAERMIQRFRGCRASPARQAGASPAAPAQEPQSLPAAGRGREDEGPSPLDEKAARLSPLLLPLLPLKGSARRAAVDAVCADVRMGKSAVYAWLKRLAAAGGDPTIMNRRRRPEAGKPQVSAEAKAAFTRRRLDKEIRRESVELSIAAVRAQFPEQRISSYSLRRVAAKIPAAATMDDARWRARVLPTGQWETPYPNHTWALDFTIGDVFLRADLPEPHIYRPWLTAIVDECSHCCMFGLYTEQAPNRETLQAVLLNAILPKADRQWVQCGAPEHLHADNGKVQGSEWLEQVCVTMQTEVGLMGDVRHSAVMAPWQNGHIESFYGIVHSRFETPLAGYCGRSPEHRPDSAPDPQRPSTWEGLLTLEELNARFGLWVTTDFHREMKHRRLGMSRLDYWQLHANGRVRLPKESWLREALMRRERRIIRGVRVMVNGYSYSHERLQSWDELEVEVRWDPGDLRRVLVLCPEGPSLWCERDPVRNVDNLADLATVKRLRRARKEERKILLDSAEVMAAAGPADREAYLNALREARDRAPIPFPAGGRAADPQPAAAEMKLLDLFPETEPAKPTEEPLIIFGQVV